LAERGPIKIVGTVEFADKKTLVKVAPVKLYIAILLFIS
jgi:hypothetical protein